MCREDQIMDKDVSLGRIPLHCIYTLCMQSMLEYLRVCVWAGYDVTEWIYFNISNTAVLTEIDFIKKEMSEFPT